MAQTKEIKTRIKTVKNIAKVTKTMQMISANRMKKAVKRSLESTPYSMELNEILKKMGNLEGYENEFIKKVTKVNNIAVVVVGPSKGFVGSMISSLTIDLNREIKSLKLLYPNAVFTGISIHKMGLKIVRANGLDDMYHFSDIYENTSVKDLVPIFSLISNKYKTGEFDLVYLCYINFQSASVRTPIFSQLLPVTMPVFKNEAPTTASATETFEPSSKEVLDFLIKEYFEKQILNAILSSNASEHSARMMTMKNATDNAFGLIQDLTLNYNKGRQAQITEQIIEVASY
jgi:F-type H+-transporting ATPase subunit gamma